MAKAKPLAAWAGQPCHAFFTSAAWGVPVRVTWIGFAILGMLVAGIGMAYLNPAHVGAVLPLRFVAWAGESAADPCEALHPLAQPTPAADKSLVLVTGGAGFIGSNLVELLLSLGYRVRVMDNLYTGDASYLDRTTPDLEFMYGDVRRLEDCKVAMEGNVTGVFHLAAMSKVLPSMADVGMARFCMDNNVAGTHNVLRAALEAGTVKKVVYAASSTVYGRNPVPHSEGQLQDPQTPYATSKFMGEMLMKEFDDVFHLPTLSIRFFMVFGKRQPAEGPYAIVTGRFVDMLKKGQPLRIEGDGKQSRDFIHVSDIARALVLGFQSGAHGTTINAGTGRDYSVNYLAGLVSSERQQAPARSFDLRRTLADTCRAKNLLHFEAKVDFTAAMTAEVELAKAGNDTGLRFPNPVVDAEFVIAEGRGENLTWLNDTAMPRIRRFIYDKRQFEGDDVIPVNQGGETLPFLFHIIRHYNDLPSLVFFTQADPLAHANGRDRYICLTKFALERRPLYVGMGPEIVETNYDDSTGGIWDFANETLKVWGIPLRQPNHLTYNGIFAASREASTATRGSGGSWCGTH